MAFALIILYVWGAAVAIDRLLLANRTALSFFAAHMSLTNLVDLFAGASYIVAPLIACIAIVRNYLVVKDPDEHRRARWITFGSVAGIVPYAIVRALGFFSSMIGTPTEDGLRAYHFAVALAIGPAGLIPVVAGYAILKHHLFDINVVIRKSIQYLLAKSVLQFVLALPALAFCNALVTNANRTVSDVMLHNRFFVVLVLLIDAVLKYRERLRGWLDRKFFRESYQQERLLIGLIDTTKQLHSVVELSERVGSELAAAFHPETVMVFYHRLEQRAFVAGYSSIEKTHGLQISDGSVLAGALGQSDDPHFAGRTGCGSGTNRRNLPAPCFDPRVPSTDLRDSIPCTHGGGPLAEGMLVGEDVICPWHGAHFNVKTGAVRAPPALANHAVTDLQARLLHRMLTIQMCHTIMEE